MKRAYAEYKDQGLTIIGIGIQDKEANIHAFARELEMDWPVGHDTNDEIAALYGITFGAGVVYIDRAGIVQGREVKAFSPTALERSLKEIL